MLFERWNRYNLYNEIMVAWYDDNVGQTGIWGDNQYQYLFSDKKGQWHGNDMTMQIRWEYDFWW